MNADWDEAASELDEIGAVTDDAAVVNDAEDGIVTAFINKITVTNLSLSMSAER